MGVMKRTKRAITYIVSTALMLSGCVTTPSGQIGDMSTIVGPQLASVFDPKRDAIIDETKHKLDVIIPIFDPGLPEKTEETETATEGVWPELRRAEANRFAYLLKQAMDETKAFGAVRVTPDQTATGDIYVLGKILESNGEDVEIQVQVVDISGESWLTRNFDHEVPEKFHSDIRNEGIDPYAPVFEKTANRIALELEDKKELDLQRLSQLTELRFGANMNEEAFIDHLELNDGQAKLVSYPSEDDPMLTRTRSIRVRDQLFIDGLQDHYRSFSSQMEASYRIWQEQSLAEISAQREANQEATKQAALGVLVIGLAILAAAAGARSNSYSGQSAGATGAVLGGVAGAALLSNSFQTSEEAQVHREALNELGASIDVDLAPRVVEFEKETASLTGDAKAQFAQWREFLKKMYAAQATPEKQL